MIDQVKTGKEKYPYIKRVSPRLKVERVMGDVVQSGASQAVLLQGYGGVGKTFFIRELRKQVEGVQFRWLGPFDMDDAEHWLLANLENEITQVLDPKLEFFGPYVEYQRNLPKIQREQVGLESLLAYTRHGERVFFECYSELVRGRRITPVLMLDTVEAIRGLDLQPRLVRWLKELTGTVVVLAARPAPSNENALLKDLSGETPLPTVEVSLERFTEAESLEFLENSYVTETLSPESRQSLAEIADGYPLWLVMGLDYMARRGEPEELRLWREAGIERGRLKDAFLRRLMVPYRGSDFWSDAIKRLGVVRRRVSPEVWKQLMSDRALPEGVPTWDDAWDKLVALPWVRVRSGENYITLHDAVAEQLALRMIPLDDTQGTLRKELWSRAATIYRRRVEMQGVELGSLQEQTTQKLERDALTAAEAREEAVRLAAQALRVSTAFYYEMLSHRDQAMEHLVELYERARRDRDTRLMQLLWIELQRFLGDEKTFDPLDDVVTEEYLAFREWFWKDEQRTVSYQVGRRISDFLIYNGRPEEAVGLLDRLVDAHPGVSEERYNLLLLRGNSVLRVPEGARFAERDFDAAVALTETEPAAKVSLSPDREGTAARTLAELRGEALMERAYFLRQTGHWVRASDAFSLAIEVTPLRDRALVTRIQSQYAFVLALRGRYDEARDTIENAYRLAEKQGNVAAMGRSLSIRGEVARYRGDYQAALLDLERAEQISVNRNDRGYLGTVRQHMAICLAQATEVRQVLVWGLPSEEKQREVSGASGKERQKALESQRKRALDFAEDAVTLCRDYNVRELPKALNRLGRVLWLDNPKRNLQMPQARRALKAFDDGARSAAQIADAWMKVANLIEYVNACFELWHANGDQAARELLEGRRKEVEEAFAPGNLDPDAFYALRGRWDVLQAHLHLFDALAMNTGDYTQAAAFDGALKLYENGFFKIAKGYAASRTSRALHKRAEPLQDLLQRAREEVRVHWLDHLDEAWKKLEDVDKKAWLPALTSMLGELDLQFRP